MHLFHTVFPCVLVVLLPLSLFIYHLSLLALCRLFLRYFCASYLLFVAVSLLASLCTLSLARPFPCSLGCLSISSLFVRTSAWRGKERPGLILLEEQTSPHCKRNKPPAEENNKCATQQKTLHVFYQALQAFSFSPGLSFTYLCVLLVRTLAPAFIYLLFTRRYLRNSEERTLTSLCFWFPMTEEGNS